MSRYRLERPWTIDPGKWWSLGLWPDLTSVVQFIGAYDPDGTVRLRVWDVEQDEEVPATELVMLALYLKSKRRHQPDPKLDWRNCGF